MTKGSIVVTLDKTGLTRGLREHLAAVAKREHAKIMESSPRPAGFTRVVDGSVGAPFEAVKPDGHIRVYYDRIATIVEAALEILRENSPVDSGDYRDSHTIYLNWTPVDSLDAYRAGDEVFIANPVPYARKIEQGRMTMLLPGSDHVYEKAAKALASRFGNQARIKFSYESPATAYVPAGAGDRAAHRHSVDTRVPAILISPY